MDKKPFEFTAEDLPDNELTKKVADIAEKLGKEGLVTVIHALLINAEINILGVAVDSDGVSSYVSYEFPYRPKSGGRRWTKQVFYVGDDSLPAVYLNVYKYVQELREVLES